MRLQFRCSNDESNSWVPFVESQSETSLRLAVNLNLNLLVDLELHLVDCCCCFAEPSLNEVNGGADREVDGSGWLADWLSLETESIWMNWIGFDLNLTWESRNVRDARIKERMRVVQSQKSISRDKLSFSLRQNCCLVDPRKSLLLPSSVNSLIVCIDLSHNEIIKRQPLSDNEQIAIIENTSRAISSMITTLWLARKAEKAGRFLVWVCFSTEEPLRPREGQQTKPWFFAPALSCSWTRLSNSNPSSVKQLSSPFPKNTCRLGDEIGQSKGFFSYLRPN